MFCFEGMDSSAMGDFLTVLHNFKGAGGGSSKMWFDMHWTQIAH